ncbi:peptide-methionine (S)-S-oxide reductase MsrA [Pseudoteredinibacter isoporae]|uniref:Peptide methionine sulfoxide reductase MsrA n=1 Tax=Pseudoteredinibacter isoporae TaxID=570281 RepID=A0A7X0JWE2_9GAMM|nr:peptide-methionine (S)-S-oxide reductase MsrA [Pseudoteredinibacter isoporae]MBB6522968.1 peptide-methionine (S)-S-oxide reductase [Pseudoteredinibacter isoporae]
MTINGSDMTKRAGLKRWAVSACFGVATVLGAMGAAAEELATATFAGGCFWCMEKPFDQIEGVHSTVSGYIGGHKVNPTYRQISGGKTGHTEAVEIKYDPGKVSFEELLQVFWRNVDPFDGKGQFCDKGSQYRPGIFFHSAAQEKSAIESLNALKQGELKGALDAGEKVEVEITAASTFYDAEDYHQNYYQKNPVRYHYYRYRCGRDARLEAIWGPAEKGEKVDKPKLE